MTAIDERYDAVELLTEQAAIGKPEGDGWVWEAEILKPGTSLNGYHYTSEFIREAAREFEGAPAFSDHQPNATGSVRQWIGNWKNVSGASGIMKGNLHLLESEPWMREKLQAASKIGATPGVSISMIAGMKKATVDGRDVLQPQRIIPNTPRSADVVMFPSAGGRVLRAVAGTDFEEALTMARRTYQLSEPQDSNHHSIREKNNMDAEIAPVQEQINKLKTDLATSEAKLLLTEKLSASRLPQPGIRLVREHFAGSVPSGEEIDKEIKSVREALAAMVASPIRATGGAVVLMEPEDKTQIALDKLFGLRKDPDGNEYDKHVPAFRGIREAYEIISGDHDMTWSPAVTRGRVTEEWNAAGFANALGNTLYRRLVQDYLAVDYGIDLMIPPREPHRVALKDFRTHEVVRIGYMSDLPQNDPEQIDWPEIDAPTDEKAQLAAVQFGGIVSVTRKAVVNDDLGLIARIASRLGRAARRTMAQRVFNLIINNAAIYDGINLFHGSHSNLGSTALSTAELAVVRTAMRNQTEKDSNKKLGFGPWLLIVPNALESTALTANEQAFLDNNFTPNAVRYMFGRTDEPGSASTSGIKPERIIISPLLTDTNDWYVLANPDEVQTFEMGFLQGKAEPELLLADNQLVGKAFSSDRIQYKVRHEYEITPVDFRGAYKEVVA